MTRLREPAELAIVVLVSAISASFPVDRRGIDTEPSSRSPPAEGSRAAIDRELERNSEKAGKRQRERRKPRPKPQEGRAADPE